jgi:hypothetical protein
LVGAKEEDVGAEGLVLVVTMEMPWRWPTCCLLRIMPWFRIVHRRTMVQPLLALVTSRRASRLVSEGDAAEGDRFPKALTAFSFRRPKADVTRDEAGVAMHKRVKVMMIMIMIMIMMRIIMAV